jgi:hypothetical protein
LIDDEGWRRLLPRSLVARFDRDRIRDASDGMPVVGAPIWRWCAHLRAALALVLATLGTVAFATGLLARGVDPVASLRPLRILNDYGLFAVMTTTRPEIEIEGSRDGQEWRPYVFHYKVGPVDRAPVWNTPHQPRLDWQMWFAALNPGPQTWFMNCCIRILQGEPEVLALLKYNPFPDAPPRFLRSLLYEYHFTDFKTRRETGRWWKRELVGDYGPVLSAEKVNAAFSQRC